MDRRESPQPAAPEAWESERAARRIAEAAAARIARLQAATAALSGARTPDEVAEVALREGIAALGGAHGFLLVPGPGGLLDVLRSAGVPEPVAHAAGRLDHTPATDAWRSAAPVLVESDAELAARYPLVAELRRQVGSRGALAALPLRVRDRVIGVLAVSFEDEQAFTPEARAFAEALAAQAAQALDRARLLIAERVARAAAVAAQQRLAFLDALAALLADRLDEAELLDGVVRTAVPTMCEFAAVLLPDAGGALVPVAQADAAGLGPRALALVAERQAGLEAVVSGGAPLVVGPREGDPRPMTVAAAGLSVQGRSLGALVAASADPSRCRGPADLALLADVARRTALALAHARLFREVQRGAEAREEFLHVASHELRGPLGNLRLAVDLLARDVRAERGSALDGRLRKVARQAERLARLSDLLLDVSRISAGRIQLQPEPADLAQLARDAVARAGDEAEEADCPLVLDAPAPVPCTVDVQRLDQVITNLLSNAMKYGRGGEVRVAVRAGEGRAVLEIADQGIGIAPEHQARIFERFERAAPARQYPGLGLGLWIVRKLVDAHGGTVRLDSAPSRGATFTVELPLDRG
ncbi:GAF sensor signal transduction histidine kinase [Anaeromyxobacter sp. K]|uniref:sensor histidine kinase n=1 Tax=Anaeromyxobacter sp. (strain K) TaxID=447217 RepID=UPI00015F9F9D|nr:ATP-binding protein [Anaeromyxobacter sp. K]ACG72038.1 GAF sensor signal transduction histidine kinase [Anaeromyxobacter sp. K]